MSAVSATFNNDVRALLRQRIPELAEGIARANRCTAVCTQTLGYDATINDEAMALEVSRTLENIVGEGNVILTNKPFMGSEDFGCFTQHVPGVLFWLGIGTGEDDKPLHNPYFKMDLQAPACWHGLPCPERAAFPEVKTPQIK